MVYMLNGGAMVVRTENIETQKTECHIFRETETLVCLFVVSFFRFYCCCLFVCLFLCLFFFMLPRSIQALFSLFPTDSKIIIIIIIIIIHLYSAFSTRFKGAVYKNQIKLKSKNNHKKLTLKLDANYKIDKCTQQIKNQITNKNITIHKLA